MFALRDFGAGSKEAVLALADGFNDDSTLFRYVLPSSPARSLFTFHMYNPNLNPNPSPNPHDLSLSRLALPIYFSCWAMY